MSFQASRPRMPVRITGKPETTDHLPARELLGCTGLSPSRATSWKSSRPPGNENLSELTLAKLANSTVLRILRMTPKPRLSGFVLQFGVLEHLVEIGAVDQNAGF